MTTTPALPPTPPAADRHVEILNRLDPDLLHPARLAGPHAWHPWGLTRHPPTDHSVRLAIAPGRSVDAQIERITDSLGDQLAGPTWPPSPRLHVEHRAGQLTCHHHGEPIAQITVRVATWDRGGLPDRGADHYNLAGWPILDQHAALADRIHAIDPTRPDPADLADLADWVRRTVKGAGPRQRGAGLRQLLDKHRTLAPRSHDRLTTVVNTVRSPDSGEPGIAFLADALARQRPRQTDISHRTASLAR